MAGSPVIGTGLLRYEGARRHFIPDRGLASIGYGLPADRRCTRSAHTPVVAITAMALST